MSFLPGVGPTRGCTRAFFALLLAVPSCAAARDPAESDRIAELLRARPGMCIADVGAGDGEWAEELAERVGSTGRVWATEVEEDDVEEIRERMERAGLGQVRTVVGDEHDAGLPDDCCDAILLRLVYHHFTDPAGMRTSLMRALRPGGRIVVVEITPQSSWPRLEGVPDRGGHGIEAVDLIDEMTAAGFALESREDDWFELDRYCVVFRRASWTGGLDRPRGP